MRPDLQRRRLDGIVLERGESGVEKDDRARRAQIAGRAEGDRVVDILGGTIRPRTLRAVERHFLAVLCEQVLAKELAEVFEPVAETPDDRVVAPYRVLRLAHVDDIHDDDGHQRGADDEHEQHRHDLEHAQQEDDRFSGHQHAPPRAACDEQPDRAPHAVLAASVCDP